MATVKFRIDGDVKAAVAGLKEFKKHLDDIARHKGMRDVSAAFKDIASALRAASGGTVRLSQDMRRIHNQTLKINQTLKQQLTINQKIDNSMKLNVRQTINMGRAFGQAKREAMGLATVVRGIGRGMANFVTGFGASIRRAVSGIQGATGSGLGGIQSLGIGVRMSGIALGNQLSQVMSGPLSGNILSSLITGLRNAINTSAGLVSIGAQMATRIVTGISGTAIKMIGPIVGGIANALVGGLSGALALGTKGLLRSIGGFGVFAADALQGALSAVSQFAGEIVIQAGNLFTGLTEAVRGAFQAAVNVATGLLNSLLSVAQGVAEKVAGAFGKVAGAFGAVGGTLAGLALRDRIKTDSAAQSAALLFNDDVSRDRRKAFTGGVQRLGFQFPTLPPDQIAKAAEMVVSTGFQHSPEEALEFLRGILPLAEIANLREIPELARAAAKVKDLFADEIASKAGGGAREQGAFIAGRLQQVRNIGDLEIRDMSLRLGEAAGIGKVFGQTLDEILEKLALLSRGLNPEETFTAFRSLVARLQRPAKETKAMFKDVGIELKKLTPLQQKQKDALQAQQDAASKQLEGVADGKGAGAERRRLKNVIKTLQGRMDQIDLRANSRKALDIVREAAELSRLFQESGGTQGISGEQFATLFPNLRGLKGAAAESVLGKGIADEVSRIFGKDPAVGLGQKQDQKRDSLSFAFADAFKGAKEPFDTFFAAVEGDLIKFLQNVRSTFGRVSEFVGAAMNDSGAAEFGQNLQKALAPLTGPIVDAFERLMAMEPSAFWAAMNSGLEKVVAFADRTITFFTTLGGLVADLVSASPMLQELGKGLGSVASAAGGIISDLSQGDTSSLMDMFSGIREGLDELWADVKLGFANLMSELGVFINNASDTISKAIDAIMSKIKGVFGGLFAAGGVAAGGQVLAAGAASRAQQAAMQRQQAAMFMAIQAQGAGGQNLQMLAGGAAAGGVAGRTASAVRGGGPLTMGPGGRLLGPGGVPVQSGMSRFAQGAGRFGRGAGMLAAPFVAFDLGSQIAGGGDSSRGGLGDAALNIGSGALGGAAIGSMIAPGIGTAIGAIAGSIVGLVASLFNSSAAREEEQASRKAQEAAKRIAKAQEKINLANAGFLLRDGEPVKGTPRELARERIVGQEALNRENPDDPFGKIALQGFQDAWQRALEQETNAFFQKLNDKAAFDNFNSDSALGKSSFLDTIEKARNFDTATGLNDSEKTDLQSAADILEAAVEAFPKDAAGSEQAFERLRAAQDVLREAMSSHLTESVKVQNDQFEEATKQSELQGKIFDVLMKMFDQGVQGDNDTAGKIAGGKVGAGQTIKSKNGDIFDSEGNLVVKGADVAAQKAAMVKKAEEAKIKAQEKNDPLNPANPDFKKNVLMQKAQMKKALLEKQQKANEAVQIDKDKKKGGVKFKHPKTGEELTSFRRPDGTVFTRDSEGKRHEVGRRVRNDPFAQSGTFGTRRGPMGRRLNDKDSRDVRPSFGGFGIISGRAMRNRRRDAENGIFTNPDGTPLGNINNRAPAAAAGAGGAAGGGDGLGKAAADVKQAAKGEADGATKQKELVASMEEFVNASKKAHEEMANTVTGFAEQTASTVGDLAGSIEDLKAEVESLKEQVAASSSQSGGM